MVHPLYVTSKTQNPCLVLMKRTKRRKKDRNEMCSAPVTWEHVGKKIPLEFRAGFVGVKQRKDGAVTPDIGWFICHRGNSAKSTARDVEVQVSGGRGLGRTGVQALVGKGKALAGRARITTAAKNSYCMFSTIFNNYLLYYCLVLFTYFSFLLPFNEVVSDDGDGNWFVSTVSGGLGVIFSFFIGLMAVVRFSSDVAVFVLGIPSFEPISMFKYSSCDFVIAPRPDKDTIRCSKRLRTRVDIAPESLIDLDIIDDGEASSTASLEGDTGEDFTERGDGKFDIVDGDGGTGSFSAELLVGVNGCGAGVTGLIGGLSHFDTSITVGLGSSAAPPFSCWSFVEGTINA